jgi:hypothetical protein
MAENRESDPRTALAGHRTSFAKFRTSLALDRTTLAWIRTAVTFATLWFRNDRLFSSIGAVDTRRAGYTFASRGGPHGSWTGGDWAGRNRTGSILPLGDTTQIMTRLGARRISMAFDHYDRRVHCGSRSLRALVRPHAMRVTGVSAWGLWATWLKQMQEANC